MDRQQAADIPRDPRIRIGGEARRRGAASRRALGGQRVNVIRAKHDDDGAAAMTEVVIDPGLCSNCRNEPAMVNTPVGPLGESCLGIALGKGEFTVDEVTDIT